MIEMHIYGIVPDKGPQVYNIAPSLIADILDGCIPQSSSEFRDVYAAWMDRYAPGAMQPEEWTPDRVPPEWAKKMGGTHAMILSGPTLKKMGIKSEAKRS